MSLIKSYLLIKSITEIVDINDKISFYYKIIIRDIPIFKFHLKYYNKSWESYYQSINTVLQFINNTFTQYVYIYPHIDISSKYIIFNESFIELLHNYIKQYKRIDHISHITYGDYMSVRIR